MPFYAPTMKKLMVFLFIMLYALCVFPQTALTHDVYFDTDKYEIPSTEASRLLLFISNLADFDIESISIFGFCDDVGADSYNLKLCFKGEYYTVWYGTIYLIIIILF